MALCNYKKDGACSSFKGCGESFCADCGHVPSYNLCIQNTLSYIGYDARVPKEVQEQNFEILKEKYGFKRNDETMKIRYCNNCEEKFKAEIKCTKRGKWLLALFIILFLVVLTLAVSY